MTISSTTNTVSYTGNGSTTEFAVNYVFFGTGTSAEIQVVEVVIATGAETVKSNGSDFTVSGGNGATGTVTAAVAPASTVKWVINRATTQTQETDYVENDPFPAESHEEALDRLTAVDQEQQRALDRTAQLPDGYTGSFDPTLPVDITGSTVLAFNAGATAFEVGPTTAAISGAAAEAAAAAASATESANSATAAAASAATAETYAGTQSVDLFNGTGSQTAFTMSATPQTENNTSVFISGVYQQKNTYSVSGTTLTFSTAPPSGTGNIEVMHMSARAIETPADGSVTYPKFASGLVDTDLSAVSGSDDTIASAKAIKTYVDAQVGTADTLSEVLALGNTSGGTNLIVSSGDAVTTNTISETTAASGVTIDGVLVKDGEVDGRDVSVDGTKLDTVETNADVTDATNVAAALTNGVAALTSGEVTQLANIGTAVISAAEWGYVAASTQAYDSADHTKLNGIEALADVTDATNVLAALVGQEVVATGFTGTLDGVLGGGTPAAASVTTLTTTGNAGIGRASTTYTLEVDGAAALYAASTETRTFEVGYGRTGNGYSYIDLIGDATYTDYGLRILRNNTGPNTSSLIYHRGTGDFSIITQEAANITLRTANTERMRVTSAGLVGIGLSAPAVPLHISSATPSIRLTDTDDNSDAQIGAAGGGLLVFDADINNEVAGSAMLFRVDGGSEKMRITSSGLVGIGIAVPTEKLDVVGNVAVSGTIVLNTTPISGFTQVGTETSYSQVTIAGDTVDQIAIAGSKVNGFKTVHNFGSSSTKGGRHGIYGVLIQDAATSATNTDRNYVGVQGQVISAVGDGGTAATMAGGKGAYFGMSSIASISSGATNLLNVTGAEINTRVLTGASAGYISGLQIVTKDEVNGGDYDTALAISKGGTGTVGKDTGILFGDMNGSHPVNSTGTLIETTGSATVAKGIDFTSYTFTGDVLSAPNVSFKSTLISAAGSSAIIELGSLSAANTPAVDFHSSGNNIDHDARIICSGGTGVLGNGVLGVVAAALRPQPDNTTALGGASNRWTEVFAVAGTINTSDEREKQDIASLDESELRVATAIKGLIKKFRWKHAVERKGDAARIHVGVIAQEVEAAFEAEGLNGFDYGVLCYDEWDEELDGHGNVMVSAGNRYGIRYDELLAFVISAL